MAIYKEAIGYLRYAAAMAVLWVKIQHETTGYHT